MDRRSFLKLGAFVAAGTVVAGCSAETAHRPGAFANRLRVPPLLSPDPDASGVRRFELTLRPGSTELIPGKRADTWGINGDHLGPTLRMRRGDRVAMAVTNRIGEPTTLHWHGMRLPARMDGGPHQTIRPDGTWRPEWTVDQPAATGWYHPHPHEQTARHVYRGLAGMIQIADPEAAAPGLPSEYGVDDIPLILQDKRLDSDGRLVEDFGGTFGLTGDTILVNGTFDPFVEVPAGRTRFRVLNASNARIYFLEFADGREFHVIAGDGGLLPGPVGVRRAVLSPGERLEFVASFTSGEQVVLRSVGERTEAATDIEEGDFDLLKIIATGPRRDESPLPGRLSAAALPEVPPGARVRRMTLTGSEINGKDMDMTRIDEVVPAGAREIWEIHNTTYTHNFHIHEVAFRILEIDGAPPPAYLSGAKDTVYVPKHATVRLAVEFGRHADPAAPYMYHCHILRHEDKGMMGQFVIVAPGTEDRVSRLLPMPGHDHGG
ncbi:multicopper oxidase domain-containing protein [Amycolatopsis sp. EV170708-02-1]|uniref:multicopper oxidase domain-containing protein n=1 Tax=Amycolatopsis sp. EV170708-02-1 TaxID=2919322 RepID=UPI001F0BB50A|nr:multicopper oxidase domain-containing protein [Amycolatopsis sp. EV170708-02-1]UMP06294.1 multicopper oxidase domain-containing protein [Amycolatopsis sp. EV170708-02-1]